MVILIFYRYIYINIHTISDNIYIYIYIYDRTAVRAAIISGGSGQRLLIILCAITAIFSSFLDNVTTILLFVPVTIEICRLLKLDPKPYLISEVMFCNIGGAATLIGDPPNILIGSAYPDKASFDGFLIHVAPAVIICCFPIMWYLLWYYRNEIPKEKREFDIDTLIKKYPVTDQIQLARISVVLGFVLMGFLTEPVHHISAVWLAVSGAVAVMLMCGHHHHHLQVLLMNIEWETLLFFAGLFVIVESVRLLGVISAVGTGMSNLMNDFENSDERSIIAIIMILWVAAIGTAILDSIPCALLMIPIIQQLSDDSDLRLAPLIWALSLGACLGGNATLVGASANLVMAGLANKEKIQVSSVKFSYVGIPVTIITCIISTLYLLIRYVFLA